MIKFTLWLGKDNKEIIYRNKKYDFNPVKEIPRPLAEFLID